MEIKASSFRSPPVLRKAGEALAANKELSVPAATAEDVAALRALFASPAGSAFLAQLRSPGLVDAPIVRLDPSAENAVFRQSRALRELGLSKTALGAGTGAMVGGGVAAIAELTTAVDQTGLTKLLVTIAGAVVGAGVGGALGGGVIRELEWSVDPDGTSKLKLAT